MARSPTSAYDSDLEDMSDTELRDLLEKVKTTISDRIRSRMDEFRAMAREAGYEVTVTRIGEEGGARRRRRAGDDQQSGDRRNEVASKYRNPDNSREVWSGRGRKPKWVEDKLAGGGKLEELLIKPARETEEANASAN